MREIIIGSARDTAVAAPKQPAPNVLGELLETAAWLDERAAQIDLLAMSLGRGSKCREALMLETVRMRGRANLLRFVVSLAKTGGGQ